MDRLLLKLSTLLLLGLLFGCDNKEQLAKDACTTRMRNAYSEVLTETTKRYFNDLDTLVTRAASAIATDLQTNRDFMLALYLDTNIYAQEVVSSASTYTPFYPQCYIVLLDQAGQQISSYGTVPAKCGTNARGLQYDSASNKLYYEGTALFSDGKIRVVVGRYLTQMDGKALHSQLRNPYVLRYKEEPYFTTLSQNSTIMMMPDSLARVGDDTVWVRRVTLAPEVDALLLVKQ